MEEIIKYSIYLHAFFGGLGLIMGIFSITAKKGGNFHKKSGRLFSIGMISSSLLSLPISWMPGHQNLFLFLIGVFTIYLVIVGNRALTFNSPKKQEADFADKFISGSMVFFSLIMLGFGFSGYFFPLPNSLLYLFFGGFGLFMSQRDFNFYKNFTKNRNSWVVNHIGKMVGALIASVTAFIVAGINVASLIAWIAPSVLGTVYIFYWKARLKKKPAGNLI